MTIPRYRRRRKVLVASGQVTLNSVVSASTADESCRAMHDGVIKVYFCILKKGHYSKQPHEDINGVKWESHLIHSHTKRDTMITGRRKR